jgi:ABC-type polysaccharide/polyol phosphate export permease
LGAVFSHVVRGDVENYRLFLFAGLLPWNFFLNSTTLGVTCFVESEHYIKKVYLPKLVFPISRLALALVDFIWALTAFSLLGWLWGIYPTISWLALPFAILSLTLFSVGVVLVFSVLNVYFRDVQYLVGVFMQMLYFLTPILYPLEMIPGRLFKFISLNPVYSQIEVFQQILHRGIFPPWQMWGEAFGIAILSLVTGLIVLSAADDEIVFRL